MPDHPDALRAGVSLRAAQTPPFHAMAMAERASARERAGGAVLHLEIGQPATAAPARAIAAGVTAMNSASLGYTTALGIPALRERIAAHYAAWYDVTVEARQVLVVAGASAGFSLAFLACFDPGQRVGVIEPGYPCYRNALAALGIDAVAIPVGADTHWAPTPEMLDAAGPLDGLIIASPSNPTGAMLDDAQLAAIVEHCVAGGIRLISDEIYHGITAATAATTALAHSNEPLIINSFSKYFSMTGWRLGWVIAPDELIEPLERLQQNLYICAPHISQVVGLAAFECADELDGHVDRYRANRSLLLDGLAAAGITDVADADGAFYVYADVTSLTDDSMQLCGRWLDELGIASTPGIDFDPQRGQTRVRFSYAGSAADISGACERLATWSP